MAQMDAKKNESRFCATVLRREAIIAPDHTTACAGPGGDLRAAAKPGADGRNHELLPKIRNYFHTQLLFR